MNDFSLNMNHFYKEGLQVVLIKKNHKLIQFKNHTKPVPWTGNLRTMIFREFILIVYNQLGKWYRNN
jgi:hypothetical protein